MLAGDVAIGLEAGVSISDVEWDPPLSRLGVWWCFLFFYHRRWS